MATSKRRKTWIIVIAVIAIAVIGVSLYFFFSSRSNAKGDGDDAYTALHPTWEALTIRVDGDGYVRGKDRQTFYTQATTTVENILHEEGEAVAGGEVIAVLRSDELTAQIREASQSLSDLMNKAAQANLSKHQSSVSAPAAGRLKWIVEEGGNLSKIQDAYGAIGYISQDKRMQVSLNATGLLSEGETLTLLTDQGEQSAKVARVNTADDRDIIEVEGDTLKIQPVEARSSSGVFLGKGLLLPANGIPVLAAYGTADTFDANENDQVSRGSKLLTLQEDYTPETQAIFSQLRQAQDARDALLAKQEALVIRAPYDCVITGCKIEEGVTLTQGTEIVSIISQNAFEIVASIDEMDIAYIELGQPASVTFDALRGEVFDATVSRISTAGQYENGVATFDVFLDLESVTNVFSGMSAQVTITAMEQARALMIPKEAIVYQDESPYVLTPEGTKPVTLGVLSGDSVEILSGVDASTSILIKTRKDASGGLTGGGT